MPQLLGTEKIWKGINIKYKNTDQTNDVPLISRETNRR
jgi:hypothetical protein